MNKKPTFTQGILIASILLLIVIAIFRKSGEAIGFLAKQELDEWVYFFIFSAISSLIILTLYRIISEKYQETKVGIKYIAYSFFLVSISTYLVLRYQGVTKDYQTSLALFASSSLLGAGWWVQATISSAAARKAHTVNTIMSHRYSELFFKRNDNATKNFPPRRSVHPTLVDYANNPSDKKFVHAEIPEHYVQAVRDFNYVLNFYEFISVGVISGDFEERLVKECYEEIVTGLEKRGYYAIKSHQRLDGEGIFCNLIKLVDRWNTDGSLTTRAKNNMPVEPYDMYPSQEVIDKMLNAKLTTSHSEPQHEATPIRPATNG
ncbi:DUF4760 domain-containing protein [Pseudomonas sp. D8002]|uniref:DUF4760 domain-containing protein n=1 Tax=Pseudomonas sp. D8002 TaxID=2738816 RepID=UPI0015A00182|nr:DUF4760 domain-containing protein [Pseudomonas sp. D8002]NWA87619.1 DUF4760 domain-containing protein [Pseudomonas sp. D8002]